MSPALLIRFVLALLMTGVGATILVRIAPFLVSGGLSTLPGIVLGAAMVALGVHRISLILRLRRTP